MIAVRGALPAALIVSAVLALSGCSSMRTGGTAAAAPEQLQPVEQSRVAQTALPPIGQDGTVQVAGGTTPMSPGPLNPDPSLTGQPGANIRTNVTPTGTGATTVANTDGTFVTLDSVGAVSNQPGRDLTNGLTVTKLLGGWTVVSGASQCRLNLTQTAKTGTARFRASTPGCQVSALSTVSSWELAGNQVKLFDEQGNILATLNLSGNRFVGVGLGGIGISMVS